MKTLTLILLTALAIAGCGGGEDSSPGTPSDSPDGDWELVSGIDPVPGFPITLSIEGTEAGGRAACNAYFGTVTVNGDQIGFGEFGQTAMACDPAAMEAEGAFIQALGSITDFSVNGTRLTLHGTGEALEFEPVEAVPTSALIDTEWILETLIEGEAASSVAGDPATLLLKADGTLTGSTGCRELTGRWLENGGVIVVPELSADGDCPDDLWKQDSLVVTVVGDEFKAEIDGDRLTLTSMGGDGLGFRTGS